MALSVGHFKRGKRLFAQFARTDLISDGSAIKGEVGRRFKRARVLLAAHDSRGSKCCFANLVCALNLADGRQIACQIGHDNEGTWVILAVQILETRERTLIKLPSLDQVTLQSHDGGKICPSRIRVWVIWPGFFLPGGDGFLAKFSGSDQVTSKPPVIDQVCRSE